MGYIGREDIEAYYFKNESIIGLLKEIAEFMEDGRNDLFQIKTEEVVIEWDNAIEKYIASIYLRRF